MTTNKSSSHPYDQVSLNKFRSQSSESLNKVETKVDLSSSSSAQNGNALSSSSSITKPTKMKKSQTALNGFETKGASAINSTSILRRRFSLFRIKRPQPTIIHSAPEPTKASLTDDSTNVHALQQIINQLRHDLQMKTTELESMRERMEKKRSSIATIPSTDSIEQAMQLQTLLNARLEEMLIENDLLKKSIHELETYAQHQQQQQQQSPSCKLIDLYSAGYIISLFVLHKNEIAVETLISNQALYCRGRV